MSESPIRTDRSYRARRRWVLLACFAAMFMAAVEATIIATAMPTIVAELGAFDLFSWVFAVYLLMQAVMIPIYGRIADILGRKWTLIAGTGIFLLGTTLCGLSHSMVALIAFRALQGIGAGALTPISYTIIADLYFGAERARIQGYLNIIWGVSAVTGPLLGAFLSAHIGWQSIFWINLPIGAVSLVILLSMFQEQAREEQRQVDYLGSALLVIGVGSLMLTLIQATHLSGALILGLLVVAAVALGALVLHERRVTDPVLPVELWRNPVVIATHLGSIAMGAVMMATNVFVPMYVQGLMGRSPVVAGFALTSQSVAWTISGAIVGWIIVRRSYREISIWGGLSFVAGMLFLITLSPERGPLWAAAAASLVGLGLGFNNTLYLLAAQASVGYEQRGVATSGNIFMRMAGQAIGTAIFGGILNLVLAGGGSQAMIDRLMAPDSHRSIISPDAAATIEAMSVALHTVFMSAMFFALLALALSFLLPNHPMARAAR